ncbi:hypothetical protein FDECE_11990 [Fusarium decemcellulare]|nr:hypothetical protein FDECE_11990 [Fusarium decemcellulare]
MILPVEVIGLIAENLAQPLAQSSPFLESTTDAKRSQWWQQYMDLLNLTLSCRDVHRNTRHLLYAKLVLEKPRDLIIAFVDILKHPHVGRSIRHIRFCTELTSSDALREARQFWLSNHTQDTVFAEDMFHKQGFYLPGWHELTNPSRTSWEGFEFPDGLAVAFVYILYMATELESLSFQQSDIGWETLTHLQLAIDRNKQAQKSFLGSLRGLQCHLQERKEWMSLGRWLFSGEHENMQILVLEGMSLRGLSAWSDTIQVENTHIEELYLGPRGKSKPAIPNSRFNKQEWVQGTWLAGGPRLEDAQLETARSDDEGWGPIRGPEARRRKSNLSGFKHLRVLDVVADPPSRFPSKTLVTLKNLATSLEVFRIEGYPFCIYIRDGVTI